MAININVFGGCPNITINCWGCVMADQYIKRQQGTLIQWMASGGDYVLTLTSLANGSARMGVYADLGASWHDEWVARVVAEAASAPTAGLSVEAYLAWSHSTSEFPAGVTGADGAWPADLNEDEWIAQLGNYAARLIATNDGSGTIQKGPWHSVFPQARYVAPVVDNNLGVAFHSTVANLRFEMMPKIFVQTATP